MTDAPNQTIAAFGYPATVIRDYGSWVVLLRPAQPTLGSLVLASTELATAFSDLSDDAFATLPKAVKDIIAKTAVYAGVRHKNMAFRVGYERRAFQAAFQARLDRELAKVGAEARVDVTMDGDVRVFVGFSGTF